MAGPCLEAEREKPVFHRQRMVDEPLGPGSMAQRGARECISLAVPALKTLGRR